MLGVRKLREVLEWLFLFVLVRIGRLSCLFYIILFLTWLYVYATWPFSHECPRFSGPGDRWQFIKRVRAPGIDQKSPPPAEREEPGGSRWRQGCRNCSYLVTFNSKHECFKKFYTYCNKKQHSGHLCYVAPKKPSKLSNKYLYAFFDRKSTQYLQKRDGSFEHVPNLICAQQMCCQCEAVEYVNVDCEQCEKRAYSFWQIYRLTPVV